MAVERKKTGLLGGSFDPVHLAHIALADAAYRTLNLDDIQLIPAGNPWQRAPLEVDSAHRLAMLALAVEKRDWLQINPIEIERSGPTYTIDTLEALPRDAVYYWILGSDQLENFCSWHRWRDIAQHAHLIVASRPGSPGAVPAALNQHLRSIGRTVTHIPFTPMAISATAIRKRLEHGKSADHFLNPAVAAYIRQHRLYKNDVGPQHTV